MGGGGALPPLLALTGQFTPPGYLDQDEGQGPVAVPGRHGPVEVG